ncbi:hypothetical protein ACFQLX_14115 [Streptomyces polyrhachis]|uniref:Uncharacterized protein n=1 Tax=Streptomyces polyrhachis TaxID=1282885 RepID=A0ABW2GEW7_9ACTN
MRRPRADGGVPRAGLAGPPFDRHDLAELQRSAAQVPGFDPDRSGLAIVSLSGVAAGVEADGADLVWSADDVVGAWRADLVKP